MQSARRAEERPFGAAQAQIRVAYSNGRWRVTESGARNVVSCFGERRDAMEYARATVQRTQASLIVQ